MNRALHIFPTLECVISCEFCAIVPKGMRRVLRDDRYISPDRWEAMIQMAGPDALYITGGEPMLYPGVEMLINAYPCPVWFYTNGAINMRKLLTRIERKDRFHVRLSFHPNVGWSAALNAAAMLRDNGIQFAIHAVETSPLVREWVKRFRDKGFTLHLDPDFRASLPAQGKASVRCNVPNVVVGPDGIVYPCTSKLVRGVDSLYPLDRTAFDKRDEFYRCSEPDACSPCDSQFMRRSA